MATYAVTDSPERNWDDRYNYKYRYKSRDGRPVAQDEVDRRRAAGLPVVLWRWENFQATEVERHNV
jgi:hypothetical protein